MKPLSLHDIPVAELINLGNMIYNIALGMLHNPQEAEDVSQEILLLVNSKLSGFRGDSALSTWVYVLTRNYLLSYRQKSFREPLSFELFEQDVTHFKPFEGESGLTPQEERIYTEEIKTGCTTAMLQCLDPENRFIFILGSLFEFDSLSGGEICGITPENFRKRLSRSRQKMENFMKKNCGLLNSNALCHCRRRISIALERGRINTEKLLYKTENIKIRDTLKEMNSIDEIARIFRDNPFIDRRELFESLALNDFSLLKYRSGHPEKDS